MGEEAIKNLQEYQDSSIISQILGGKGIRILRGNYSQADVDIFFVYAWLEIERTIFQYYDSKTPKDIDPEEFKSGSHLSLLTEHKMRDKADWIFYAKDLRNSLAHYEFKERNYRNIGSTQLRDYNGDEDDYKEWNSGGIIYKPENMPDDTQEIVENFSEVLVELKQIREEEALNG